MGIFKEDERLKMPMKQKQSEDPKNDLPPLRPIADQAAIKIEMEYQAASAGDPSAISSSAVELGNLPPNFIGENLYFIQIDMAPFMEALHNEENQA